MNAPFKPTSIQGLRERYGDDCWFCGGGLAFDADSNSKKAATREHLVAQSLGGTDTLDNLVLCHKSCNQHLKDRPKAQKLEMRDKTLANRAKQAGRTKSLPKDVARKSSPMAVALTPVASKAPVIPSPPQTQASDWQRIAIVATASATFFAGLCLGMLIG